MKKLVLDKNTIKTLRINTNIKTGNSINTANCPVSSGGIQTASMVLSGSKPPRSFGGSASVGTMADTFGNGC